jgi:hypothetical protein
MIDIITEVGIDYDGDKSTVINIINMSYETQVNKSKLQYRSLKNTYFKNLSEIGDETYD